MAKKNKPLLNEGTVRRMMKLANMEALGDNFIAEKFTVFGGGAGEKSKTHPDTPDYKGKRRQEEDLDPMTEQPEFEAAAEEEEVGDVDFEAEEEVIEPEGEGEGEVTISEEEAQCVIDLADKLRGAVGGEEPEEDVEMEAEFGPEGGEELEAEEEVGEGPVYEEELYEAALRGLDIALVDDKKVKLAEIKSQVYKRVVARLLKETKTPK